MVLARLVCMARTLGAASLTFILTLSVCAADVPTSAIKTTTPSNATKISTGIYQAPSNKGLPKNYPHQRLTVNSQEMPWRTIGQVNVGGRARCSGVLIGNNRVLTVAHCLWSTISNDWVPARYVHFLAGFDRGKYLAYSKVKSYTLAKNHSNGHAINLNNTHLDWAILELEKPVGEQLGFLPLLNVEQAKKGQAVTLAGYRGDRSEVLTVQHNCELLSLSVPRRVLNHNCAVIGGDSGGPLLTQWKQGWAVLGIQSLEVMQGEKVWGVAVAIHPKYF